MTKLYITVFTFITGQCVTSPTALTNNDRQTIQLSFSARYINLHLGHDLHNVILHHNSLES